MIAVRWMRLALIASIGACVAQSAWSADYEQGKAALDRHDFATALAELEPLAVRGDAHAQVALGSMYLSGLGVPKDASQASRWFRLAAGQGNAEAQRLLGNLYLNGDGVPRDDSQAVAYIRRAADAGDAEAQTLMGGWCRYGWMTGVPQDREAALSWLRKAAANGSVPASKALDYMSQEGSHSPQPVASASEPIRYSDSCINGDCVRTFSDGRKVRFQAAYCHDALSQQWVWKPDGC